MDMLILDPEQVKAYAESTGKSAEHVALEAIVTGCSSYQRSHPRKIAMVSFGDGGLKGRIVDTETGLVEEG